MNKECSLCPEGWIQFQEKCYLFNNLTSPWWTWDQSRQHCRNRDSDLVVVESLEQQTFIKNHIHYYYDKWHGYWIGLHLSDDKNWRWVDGSNDTLRYWVTEPWGDPGLCTLMIPYLNDTTCWDGADCEMWNRFICEVNIRIGEQRTYLSEVTAQNEQLISQKNILEKEAEELRREKDNLERMIDSIFSFKIFPVKEFCPQKSECFTMWFIKCSSFS
ncbi:hypothetical protein LDENG_00174790 [Lucifuga dentata]|nr:hypothetical protein LDENG_00174790 [Lucifuga dentata]